MSAHEAPGRGRASPSTAVGGPSVFIVGAGRMGIVLARNLAAAGWAVEAWSRTPKEPQNPTAARSSGGRTHQLPPIAPSSGELPPQLPAQLVLLTVPDGAIAAMAAQLASTGRVQEGQVVAHCSGSLGLEVLEPIRVLGAAVGSLHPLAAAASPDMDLRGYTAAIDGSRRAVDLLRRLALDVGLSPIEIPPAQRSRYHAAASIAANGLVSLAAMAVELLGEAGVEPEAALRALIPLFRSAVQGLEGRGLPDALTGPVARGDAAVVREHLEALGDTPIAETYRLLAQRAAALASAQGKANPKGLEEIVALLEGERPTKK